MALFTLRFNSCALKRDTSVSVFLPEANSTDLGINVNPAVSENEPAEIVRSAEAYKNYYNRDKKFKTIWALHGGSGSDIYWLTNSNLYQWAMQSKIAYSLFCKFRRYAGEIGFKATFEEREGEEHNSNSCDASMRRAIDFFGFK